MNIEDLPFDSFPGVKYNLNPGIDHNDIRETLRDLEEAILRDKVRLEHEYPDPVFMRHFAEMLAEYQKMKLGFIDPAVQEMLGTI